MLINVPQHFPHSRPQHFPRPRPVQLAQPLRRSNPSNPQPPIGSKSATCHRGKTAAPPDIASRHQFFRACHTPYHFPRTTPRILEFALPRPRNHAHWNPRSRALSNLRSPCAAALHTHCAPTCTPPRRAISLSALRCSPRRFRANARASPAPHVRASPHIHSPQHALAPLPRASRRRIVSNTQLMMQRKERRCAASVFIALCF